MVGSFLVTPALTRPCVFSAAPRSEYYAAKHLETAAQMAKDAGSCSADEVCICALSAHRHSPLQKHVTWDARATGYLRRQPVACCCAAQRCVAALQPSRGSQRSVLQTTPTSLRQTSRSAPRRSRPSLDARSSSTPRPTSPSSAPTASSAAARRAQAPHPCVLLQPPSSPPCSAPHRPPNQRISAPAARRDHGRRLGHRRTALPGGLRSVRGGRRVFPLIFPLFAP